VCIHDRWDRWHRPQQPLTTPSVLATMHPASFALVMATGIVSIASQLLGLPLFAVSLLWATSSSTSPLDSDRFAHRSLSSSSGGRYRAPRAISWVFTTVAATCMLGNQFWIVVHALDTSGSAMEFRKILLWAVITYTVFTVLTVKAEKPSLAEE
jgi:hypothetical protein